MNKKITSVLAGTFFALVGALSIGAMSAYALAPSITTVSASSITQTSVTLKGTFNGNGAPNTNVSFAYDLSSDGFASPHTTLPVTLSSSGPFSVSLGSLTPGTKYDFQAYGVNPDDGTAGFGVILSFTTLSNTPTISTTPAQSVTSNSATIRGAFQTNGSAINTWFEYASNSSFSSSITTDPVSHSAGSTGLLDENISGLSPNTTYYFRAFAQNVSGGTTVHGTPMYFTTSASSGISCNIDSFTADVYSVSYGGSTTLRWSAPGCGMPELTSSNGTYSNTPVSGTYRTTGAISTTTSFTLTVYDLSGTSHTSNPVVVTVSGTTGSTCAITNFYPYSYTVAHGGNTTLAWTTTGNCVALSIDNGIGAQYSIASGTANTPGLTYTITYTLTATDASGSTTARPATISVSPGTPYYTGYTGGCTVTSFYANPSQINYLGSTTLFWTSTGCSSVMIPGVGNSYNASGSALVSGLYHTTTYDIYGYGPGSNSIKQSATINVSGNNQPYYAPTQYTPPTASANVLTTVATNIGSTSARLNGLVYSTNPVSAYFEYGPTPSLGFSTTTQSVSGSGMNYFSGINVSPLTTYYYRAVISANGTIQNGNIVSFKTLSKNSSSVFYYSTNTLGTTTSTTTTGIGTSTTTGVTIDIKNKNDKINVGDTIEDTVTYTNGTNKSLTNAILTVVFPTGLTAKQASQGRMVSPSTVEVDIGTLLPGQTGSVFLEATVDQNTPLSQTLVTTATLNFTLPDGSRDSAVGYILNHAGAMGTLGGVALGTGFFPTTIFGWLVTVLIILALILVARRITRAKATHGAPGHH